MRFLSKRTAFAIAVILGSVLFSASDCEGEDPNSGQSRENVNRQKTYDSLTESQPSHKGTYSPTRDTKNFWIDTWMKKPGKLSYVYILNANGDVTDYGVFKGLPVSYCTSLIPPYQIKDYRDANGGNAFTVPGPSVDGTFSSGADCATKYGKDATTGAYVEFSVGLGQGYRLYDQPLPPSRLSDAIPLGPTQQ
jgi:hypothetical protein